LYDCAPAPGPYLIASNNGWTNNPTLGNSPVSAVVNDATATIMTVLGAFAYEANSLDSAVVITLPTGSYTSQISGVNGATGVALADIYDADSGVPPARLVNVSGRASVGKGPNVLIAGFGIEGNGPETVLLRGVGPGLYNTFGLAGYLANPQLQLYDSGGGLIASNSGWCTAPTTGTSTVEATVQPATATVMSTVGAFSLAPDSTDAAMRVTLPPGNYTALLSGTGSTAGIGLIEVYEAP